MPSFALRNPHTVIVGALVVALLGVTAFTRMPVDVFPNLKIPASYMAPERNGGSWQRGGSFGA